VTGNRERPSRRVESPQAVRGKAALDGGRGVYPPSLGREESGNNIKRKGIEGVFRGKTTGLQRDSNGTTRLRRHHLLLQASSRKWESPSYKSLGVKVRK